MGAQEHVRQVTEGVARHKEDFTLTIRLSDTSKH
jgi:hypothetical protein